MVEIKEAAEHRLDQVKYAVDKAHNRGVVPIVNSSIDGENEDQNSMTASSLDYKPSDIDTDDARVDTVGDTNISSPKPNTAIRLAPLTTPTGMGSTATALGK